ncbi:MAG: ATP-binding protein [Nitrospirota bacterium]|jgi:PAS domain S-box-containing protein
MEDENKAKKQHINELIELQQYVSELEKSVTESKQAEEQIKEQAIKLQKSQERYKNLVGAITAYTYSVEVREGRAIATKHSMGCIPVTGYNPEDYKADPYLWYSMIHPDDRITIETSIKEILAGHEVPPIEHRIIRRDGKVVWVRDTMVPYYDGDGRLVRYDGLIEDITERKRAEEEIQKLNRELGQHIFELTEANKELDAFNYSVSHDLQTPLIVIGGFIRRFLKVYVDNLDTNGIEMLNTILMHTRKMERLIKDLLSFSRLGRQQIQPTEIDMGNLVTTVLDELKPLSDGRIIKFDLKALPPGYGDAALIKQVFINLISNAIKFTTPKDSAVIEVGYRIEKNETIFYVKDNGIGFYPQYAHELFSIFHQLPGVKKFEGTGVGLSIVQRIINRHGGRVWAEGKVNEGATFHFTLPGKNR